MQNKHPQPLVSIITVVYNGELTLERTILSIMALKYDALEYIVVDGDSSDGTKDIIKRYSKSISRLISEPDKGLYDAMNKGLAIAKGEYVWFLNAGDEVARPELLKHIFDLCSDA
ncbi:MAG: glycosyltransferase, partial [Bacteroidales bacterium]|nr:glycosyltransferase [Bacteroidales bacterium]